MTPATTAATTLCAFCGKPMVRVNGQKGRTEEHCFPKWMAPYILGGGDEWEHVRANSQTGAVKNRWTKRTLNVVSKRICRNCNTVWMNPLEKTARPFLTSLIQGNGRELYADGQRLLAAWAVKTALCLELANPSDVPIPEAHYRAMAELKDTPPPRTQVFIGSYVGHRLLFHFPSMINMPDDSHGYGTTLIVGRVIFNVMAHNSSEDMEFIKGGVRADLTPQIWPTPLGRNGKALPVTWPPKLVMDETALWRYVAV